MNKSLLLFLFVPLLWGEEDWNGFIDKRPGRPVEKLNPDYDVIQEELRKIRDAYAKSDLIEPVFMPVREFNPTASKELLKGGRYYAVTWDERATDKGKNHVNLALWLGFTLVVFSEQDRQLIWKYGISEDFGAMLAKQRVKILSEEDAARVANAYYELNNAIDARVTWPNQKISESEWRLCIQTSGSSKYYYRVLTTKDGLCLSGKLCSEAIKPSESKKE